MHRLKQLNPVTHIIAPTAASVMIGIAIHFRRIKKFGTFKTPLYPFTIIAGIILLNNYLLLSEIRVSLIFLYI